MKPLMLDQMRRRWFLWALFCFVHFLFGTFNYGFLGGGFIFPAALILGPNIWLMDLQRGYSRVALTLPYTGRQIGRTWWWIIVGFAAILMVTFSFLGMTFHFLFFGKEFLFIKWFEYVTANALLYGSLFWFYNGNLNLPAFNWQGKTQRFLVLMFYLAILFGCVFLLFNMKKSTFEMAVFYICTLAMTILGWLRAESMITNYGENRNASQQSKKSPRQFKVPNSFGGIPFIFTTAFSGVWVFGILSLTIMNLLNFVIKNEFDWHHLTKSIGNGGSFFPFFFVFIFMSSVFSFSLGYTLRFLRTMPISTAKLAAVLLSVLILPLLTLFLAFTALAWKETGSVECISFFKIELLAVAPVSVFVVVSIWNTQANFLKTILLVIAIVAPLAPAFYQLTCMDGRGLAFWFVIPFSGSIAGISFWSTCQIIAKSSSAYRPRQNQFGNRWDWGR